jgi:hypothetical protein
MFHPSRPDVLLLWGAEWIASYDPHAVSETNHKLIKQKFRRRAAGTTTCGNVSVCCKYSPLVFVGTVLSPPRVCTALRAQSLARVLLLLLLSAP